ncbi:MAG: hypothetical protein K2X03_13235 [Bryobacteraceae bacterium]|nr:hypothetical protein [Bryobacteraceae bacterium]
MTRSKVILTLAALCFLAPVWADIGATVAMPSGQSLDLDTGALGTGNSADLVYAVNAGLVPLNGTLFAISTLTGSGDFDRLVQAELAAITAYRAGSIPDATLNPGVILFIKTKSGKFSKILVANRAPGTLILTFKTFTTSLSAPNIEEVQNNFGPVRQGHNSAALAPGSLISIKGTNLSALNDGQSLRSSAAPGLLSTINGVSVTVTVNGVSLNCPLYYLSPTQINAVLPGNTPLGDGTVTVTSNQDRSSPFGITVVQSSFGMVHYARTLVAAYDTSNALITRFNSANPGQTIVIWGSGVGNDPANDDRLFPQKTNNLLNVPMQVLVGGRAAAILYRGRSQFPGVDQIVATLPANVPQGCYVSLSVVTGGIVSHGVTLPVAASGKTCSDVEDRLTPLLLQTLSAKPSIGTGTLLIGRQTNLNNGSVRFFVTASFFSTNGLAQLVGADSLSMGNCITVQSAPSTAEVRRPLDAGPSLRVNIPGNAVLALPKTQSAMESNYTSSPPDGFVPAAGGIFVVENTPGGTDLPRLSLAAIVPSNFNWTNVQALRTVDRAGATVTWSGGTGATYVEISGSSALAEAFFRCKAALSAGQFTIPASVLLAVPRGGFSLAVAAVTRETAFPAPLDFFDMQGVISFSADVR